MNTNIINISVLPNLEGKPTDDQYIFSTDSEEESFKIQAKGLVFKDSTGKIKKEDLPEKKYTPKELYEAGQPFFFYLETLDGKRINYTTNKFVPEKEKAETLENIKNIWEQVLFTDGINLYCANDTQENDIFDYTKTDDFHQNSIKFTSEDTVIFLYAYRKDPYYKFTENTGFNFGSEKVEYKIKLSPIPLFNRGEDILSVFPMEVEVESKYFEDENLISLWDINNNKSIPVSTNVYGSYNNLILRNTGISFQEANIYLKQRFNTLGRTITDKYSYKYILNTPDLDSQLSDGREGNQKFLLSFAYLKNSFAFNKKKLQQLVNAETVYAQKNTFNKFITENIPFGCRLIIDNSSINLVTQATESYLAYLETLGVPIKRDKNINSKNFVIVNSAIYSLDGDTYLAGIWQDNILICACWSHYIDVKKLPKNLKVCPLQFVFTQNINHRAYNIETVQFNINLMGNKAYINDQGYLEKNGGYSNRMWINVREDATIISNPDYIRIYPVSVWSSVFEGQSIFQMCSPTGLSSESLDYRFNLEPSLIDDSYSTTIYTNYNYISAFKPLVCLIRNLAVEKIMGTKIDLAVVNKDSKYENNTPLFFFYPGQAQASHYKKLGRLKVVKDENYNYSLVKEIIPIEEAEPYIAYFEVTPELEKEILGGKPFTQREILDLLKEEKPAIFALKTLDGKYIDSTTGGVTEDTEVDDPDHPGQKIKVTKNSAFAIADRTFSSMTLRQNMQCPVNSTDECQFKFINYSKDSTWYSPLVNVVFNEDNSISLQITNNQYLNWSEDQKWRMATTKQNFIVEPTSIKYSTKDSKIFTLYSPLELHPNDNNVQVAHDIFIKDYTNTASMQVNYYESIIRQDTPSFINCENVTSNTVEFTPVHATLPPIKVNDIMGCYRQANITKLANAMIFTIRKTGGLMKLVSDFLTPFRAFILQEPPVALVNVVTQAEYDALPEVTKSSPKKIYLIYEDTTPTPGA